MKAQIFKIAGVKNEKDFYKKFPTQKAFMAQHGKELKAWQKAQGGFNSFNVAGSAIGGGEKSMLDPKKMMGVAGELAQGVKGVIEQKKQMKVAEQDMSLSSLGRQVAGLDPEQEERNYARPEDIRNTGEEFFPIYGVGTNPLSAQDGKVVPARGDQRYPAAGGSMVLFKNSEMTDAQKEEFDKSYIESYGVQPIEERKRLYPLDGGSMGRWREGDLNPTQKIKYDRSYEQAYGKQPNIPKRRTWEEGYDARGEEFKNDSFDQWKGKAEQWYRQQDGGENYIGSKDHKLFLKKRDSLNNVYKKFTPDSTKIQKNQMLFDALPKDKQESYIKDFSTIRKKYGVDKAQAGSMTPWGAIGDAAENTMDTFWAPSAGGELGGTIGKTAGSLFGPAGAAIGQVAGKAIGNLVDTDAKKLKKFQSATDRNYNAIGAMNTSNSFRQSNSAFLQGGGERYPGGGDIQTHWGGETTPVSFNPMSGDKTVKFTGDMHNASNTPGESGIGISYGGKPIEVEGGEYASIMQDGGEQEKMVVWGDLNVPKELIPEAKGKKFKNYTADLVKKEQRYSKGLMKNTTKMNELEIRTPFDKLERNSYIANDMGGKEQLSLINEKKQDAAAAQRAINDTAEELGVRAKDLSKGRLVKDDGSFKPTSSAENGTEIPKYQNSGESLRTIPGTEISSKGSKRTNWGSKDFQKEFSAARASGKDKFWWNGEWKSTKLASDTGARRDSTPELTYYDPKLELQPVSGGPADAIDEDVLQATNRAVNARPSRTSFKNRLDLEDIGEGATNLANTLLPHFRPSDQSDFDYGQLTGELHSMATNKVEPVDAQGFRPQLDVPYDVTLQDQRNQVTSATRAAQRMAGNNAPAQAMIAAQAYSAKNKINAEEFRMNQAKQDQVFSANRATMNDAQLKNLAIYDKQYERQSQARSNTRAEKLAALGSMSDKFAKHQLENKQLATYENLYNYRYGDDMRIQNMNPLARFNTQVGPRANTTTNTTTAKNGATVKKNIRFPKMLKNY